MEGHILEGLIDGQEYIVLYRGQISDEIAHFYANIFWSRENTVKYRRELSALLGLRETRIA